MSAGSGWTVWNLAELAGWLKGRWAQSAVNEPFRQNVHVFRAINVIIQVLLSLPIRVKRGDDEVTSGPAFELINRPTAGANKEDLIEEIAGHLLEAGEAHLFDPEVGNVRPREIIVAGRREMTPRFTADGRRNLLWWEYRETGSSGRPDRILPEQDSYTRLFNPYDKWRGMSPAEAFALGLQADALSQQHNVSTLKHGATPSGWLKFGQMLETNERDEYMQRLEERHRGADEAGKIGVLEGDVDWIQNQFSNVDLDLLNLRKLSREEAFEAYGVPPVMGAVFDSAHYNVADSAQEIMLWGSIAAYIGKIEGLFNGLLLPRVEPGVSLEIDLAQHPVLQRVERNKVAQFVSLVEHNVPAVLAAQWLDLPFDDVPHAKVGFMTSTVRTTDEIVEGLPALPPELPAPSDEGTEPQDDEETKRPADEQEAESGGGDAFGIREQERAEALLIDQAARPIRGRFRAHFARQERAIRRRLKQVLKPAQSAFQDGERDVEPILRRILLDLGEEAQRVARLTRDAFEESTRRAIERELRRLGFSEERIETEIRRLTAHRLFERWLRIKEIRAVGIERVTRRRLQRTLAEGLRESETVTQLSDRVHRVLGGNRLRANRIARTEAGQAVSTARFLSASAAGASGKGWRHGPNPRPSHVAAQVRYDPSRGKPIPLDQAFQVGRDNLMYPRDPAGSAGEIINCNCVMISVRLRATDSERAA